MESKDYMEEYCLWMSSDAFDEKTKKELESIAGNEEEIKDRFYRSLEFGTAGLRGVIGAGTNRMNIYTVRKASQGLANVIIREGGQDKGVAIAYDSRHMSVEFSEEAALCLNANGIKTYLFDSLRPTPELSFALRELGCIAGIVVTASHNPSEYNGYKVYWEDGAQITAPKDAQIINEVNSITDYLSLKTMSRLDAIKAGLFHIIGKEIDDRYNEELMKLALRPDVIKKAAEDISIVYTPFHGTGNLATPLGAKLLHAPEMPNGSIIGLDKNCALEMVQAGGVMTDYDKLIDRQLERAAITCTAGFAKIFRDAARVVTD